jgi:replicative DNA helicase
MELSEDDIGDRFDAAFANMNMSKLLQDELLFKTKIDKLGRAYGNSLIIKEYYEGEASTNTLKSHVKRCISSGFEPGLICVDYLGLMKPTKKHRERRDNLSQTTTDLRNFGRYVKVPVWSGAQSRRGAISQKTHTEEEIGEDIGIIATADVVATINQTIEEVHEDIFRLLVAKNRNGRKYLEVQIQANLGCLRFYDPFYKAA